MKLLMLRAWFLQLAESRAASYALALSAVLLVATLAGGDIVHTMKHRQAQQRTLALGEAVNHAEDIKRQIDHVLTAADMLAKLLETIDSERELDALAPKIIRLEGGLSSLQIDRDGVPWKTYSVTDAGATPTPSGADDALAGIQKELDLTTQGAPALTIDQRGIVASQPIFASLHSGQPRWWGTASATINRSDLMVCLNLKVLAEEGYDFDLTYHALDQKQGRTILATSHPSGKDPVIEHIRLPTGDSLVLRATPVGGWATGADAITDFSLVLISSLLLGTLIYILLRRPAQLKREVAIQTHALAEAKQSLEDEMEVRMRAEHDAERSHALLDSVFEHLPNMILIKRISDLRTIRVNLFCEQLLGSNREELVGRHLEELFPADVAARFTETDLEAIRTRGLIDLPDERIETGKAAPRWLHLKKIVLADAAGNPEHLLLLGEDITEHKNLALQNSKQLHFIQQLLEAIPNPVFYKDTEDRYLGINRAFEQFYGTTRERVIGKTIYNQLPKDIADLRSTSDRRLIASGEPCSYESTVKCADGTLRNVVFNNAVLFSPEGTPEGMVGVILDITERKAAENQLMQLNRSFAVLSGANRAIMRIHEPTKLAEHICELLVEKGAFPLAWIIIGVPGAEKNIVVVRGEHETYAHRVIQSLSDPAHPCGLPGIAPYDNQPLFCSNMDCCDAALVAEGHSLGFVSMAALPLIVNGISVGSLGILGHETGLFVDAERQVLTELAEDLSHALEVIEQEGWRKTAESSLRLSALIFENSAEGIMITDAEQHILLVNSTFTKVTGYTQEEAVGRKPNLLSSGQHDAAFYQEMMTTLNSEGSWQGEIINRRKDGKIYPEWLTLGVVKNEQGIVTHYVAMFSDISSRKQAEEKLNFLTNYDVLTALPNRRLFTDRLEQAAVAVKRGGRGISLFYLDPDRLKTINDTLGHAAGDELLRMMAKRISEQLRPGDTVARLNSDVFAVLANDIREETYVALLAEKIMTALRQPFIINGNELFINSSIGISVYPTDTEDIEVLHQHADTALHQAKLLGGNNFQFFTAGMNVKMVQRLQLENSLRRALEREEFELHYQPQVNISTGQISGAEVLLRWRSPDLGLVLPGEFIHLAEETGLIVPIGGWVLRITCAQAVAWMKQGQKPIPFAVNLSARQFKDGTLVQTIADALEQSGLPPSMLELELTESIIMERTEETITTLKQLHAMGILISIDDFGTGYSSLSYLKRLPIQILKIDQSFVHDLDIDADDKAIVSAVVALAHSLQLKVIAEGVETAGQLAYLQQINCDVMQGYYYSKPLNAGDFHALCSENLLEGNLGR